MKLTLAPHTTLKCQNTFSEKGSVVLEMREATDSTGSRYFSQELWWNNHKLLDKL